MSDLLKTTEPEAGPRPVRIDAVGVMPLGVGSSAPLHDVQFSPWIRRFAMGLLTIFLIAPLLAIFAPWQQFAIGDGRVVAFNPVDRPLPVKAPVKGRIKRVHVIENQEVEEGQLLAEIEGFDSQIVQRLEAQISAAETDIAANEAKVASHSAEISALERERDEKVNSAQAKVDAAQQKLISEQQKLLGAQFLVGFSETQLKRFQNLSKDAVRELDVLEAKAKLDKAKAELLASEAAVESAKAGLRMATADREAVLAAGDSKVAGTTAKRDTAEGKVAELQGKLEKLKGELREQLTQTIRAQRAGKVFRVQVNPSGDVVKPGDLLMTIVPTNVELAADLLVDGNDASLISVGRKVRLQFEGWPAVQFVGWPSVAIGTFGGIVEQIDATDVGGGQFRLLILPDRSEAERHADSPNTNVETGWPLEAFLRQGVRTKGWVLLNEVPLWYEIWRQLNGFPPTVDPMDKGSSGSAAGAMGVTPGKVESGGK